MEPGAALVARLGRAFTNRAQHPPATCGTIRAPVTTPAARTARAIAVRVASAAATLVGATALVQFLLAMAPGDAIDLLPNADAVRAGLAAEWGLDEPLPIRLAHTLGRTLQLDLGTSLTYRPGVPVLDLVRTAASRSAVLLLPAIALATVLALVAAMLPVRRGVQMLSVVPAFVAAYGAVTLINAATWRMIQAGQISRPDWFALPDTESSVRSALAIAVLAIASGALTELHAAVSFELRAIQQAPFIESARARGEVVFPYFARNMVAPVAGIVAGRTALTLGSLVVVEKVLLFNGAGAMLWQACQLRDYPLAIGLVLAAAAVVAGSRLTADLVGIAIDPRRR